MNYEQFVKKQDKKFVIGFERINNNRKQWIQFEERVEEIYRPLLNELKKNFKFEFFYLNRKQDFSGKAGNSNQNFIQFYMGSHYVGIQQTNQDKETKRVQKDLITEQGGSLLFSQGPQGEVLVAIYPCSSNVFKYEDDHIIYKIYDYPCLITEKKLIRIVKFYFRFMFISSYIGKVKLWDRLYIGWIKFRVSFDLLKFGKTILGTLKTTIELISGVASIT